MIDTIVFDMGGVLISWDPDRLIARLGIEGEDARLLRREVFGDVEWVMLDGGQLTEEDALFRMRQRLPERLHDAAERCVFWWKDPFWPIPGMEDLIRELKGLGYRILLLSNATSALHEYFPRIPGSDCFDGGIVSADLKLLKPQHEIYEALLEKYSLQPERCFFIDDYAPNVTAALRCGLRGSVFFGDMLRLRRALERAGVPVGPDHRSLRSWMARAEAGEPLWLPELLEESRTMEERDCVVFRLSLPDGTQRDYSFFFPVWETEEERGFVLRMMKACAFNLLSACSGAELCYYLDTDYNVRWNLIRDLIRELQEDGYGKVLRVSNRICADAGLPPLAFSWRDAVQWQPLSEPDPSPAASPLPELRAAVSEAAHGLRCGLDIGGTDIKLVVARDGELVIAREYDWDPASFREAEQLIAPLLDLLREALAELEPGDPLAHFDSIGVGFPDVVIKDRILGGETPKTAGIRANSALNYEDQLRRLRDLRDRLCPFCKDPSAVHILNDGALAAFAAGIELACGGEEKDLLGGVIAHSLGTDLGTGWLRADGTPAPWPLELYAFLIDLGSLPQSRFPSRDLRSVRNPNSELPDVRRYVGQEGAFRLAWELDPRLLEGYAQWEGEVLVMPSELRKEALEHLCLLAADGDPVAMEVFRKIGENLGVVSRTAAMLLHPETDLRCLYGRFLRHPACLELLREGCSRSAPELRLIAAGGGLCASPLVLRLAEGGQSRVASLGQAVAAVYYGIYRG